MKRFACVCVLVIGLPAIAHAEPSGPTKFGWQVFAGGGARVGASASSVDGSLEREGWSALPVAVGEAQVGFGVTLYDATISLHFEGGGYSLAGQGGREDALDVSTAAIGVELGYRARAGRFVTLEPFVGIGSTRATLCFQGVPSDATDGRAPPFEQVLANPGRTRCLEASDAALDLGLNALASFPFALSRVVAGEHVLGFLGLGPRFAFTVPLTFTRTWSSRSADAIGDLPPFEGPLAPLGGAYVGLTVVFRGGLEPAR